MKFIYKIWSGYDGFVPAAIPERRLPGGYLRLGWDRYITAVEPGADIWVYFFGSQRFVNGVYVKGVAHEVDVAMREVILQIRESATDVPLTDTETSRHIAETVRARGLQVFLLPEFLDVSPACTASSTARSCSQRRCGSCPVWRSLPRVEPRALAWPEQLSSGFSDYVPAYWVIPPRNFIYQSGRRIKTSIKQTSEMWLRFKTGEKNLAFPLALAMRECLADRGLDDDFDLVIPVPLSPDKAENGEVHRTSLLAAELAKLIGARRRNALELTRPTSKHVLQGQRGVTPARFEEIYIQRLRVAPDVAKASNVLLVDDVCTKGNTLSACLAALRMVNPDLVVVAATAGQMTVKAAVARVWDLVAR
jgi:predicted amidophosphoribosyltransferase